MRSHSHTTIAPIREKFGLHLQNADLRFVFTQKFLLSSVHRVAPDRGRASRIGVELEDKPRINFGGFSLGFQDAVFERIQILPYAVFFI